jgi:hypothetical protein
VAKQAEAIPQLIILIHIVHVSKFVIRFIGALGYDQGSFSQMSEKKC